MSDQPQTIQPDLQGVAQNVVRRAQRQGFVVPREVREELARAQVPAGYWKDVLSLARPSLRYRHGRYHYVSPAVADLRNRVRDEQRRLREVRRAVAQLVRTHNRMRDAGAEQREHPRFDLVQPVTVIGPDGQERQFLSRDVSLSGICLIGNCSLQGQKVRVLIPRSDRAGGAWCFVTRILWAAPVADGLVQQGGLFVEVVAVQPQPALALA